MWDWTLVSLWFGRTVGSTVSWSPKFLGWVDYQIFLPMVLRFVRMELCYKAASKDTKKNTFALAGIYLSRFKPHSSIRSASASVEGSWFQVPVDTILRTTGWSGHWPLQSITRNQFNNATWRIGRSSVGQYTASAIYSSLSVSETWASEEIIVVLPDILNICYICAHKYWL